jgi:TatD DNase family protein
LISLVDSHCHLDFDAFHSDRDQVIERARKSGVDRLVVPSVTLQNARDVIQLAEKYPLASAAVGVHPNSALSWHENAAGELQQLANHPKVAAIGEIGLDYYRDRAPGELQREVFRKQLDVAQQMRLPVIIHTRNTSREDDRATVDVLDILMEWKNQLVKQGSPITDRPGVLHSFSGTLDNALEAIRLGFYIGISGPVTFRNAPELQQLVARIPLDYILVETDAPFLTPHPHRGKRNEPAYVRLVTDKIADIYNTTVETVAIATTSNAERLFNW